MVRQTRIYFAGAVSGTALIGMAVVAFVVLVSLQALQDWPLASLSGNGENGLVAPARPAGGKAAARPGTAAGVAVRGGGRNASHRAGARQSDSTAAADGGRAVSGSPVSSQGRSGSDLAPAGSQPSGSADGSPSAGSAAASSGGSADRSSPSASETVTGTVDKTVSGVDEATGGALGQTGVPQTVEGAVEGVAGPESTLGGTLDHTVEAVGGLLGGGR